MAQLIRISTHSDSRGELAVLGDLLPFSVRRVFFIHNVPQDVVRGGHRHRKNRQALLCANGSCEIVTGTNGDRRVFTLSRRDECLLLDPDDYHEMRNFSPDSVLMVLASEPYDPDDYLYGNP